MNEMVQEVEIETEVGSHSDAEQKAIEQGWAPQEEWRGDPDKWVDAETFVERGERSNAILRERNDKLFTEISSLKKELQDSVKSFGEANRRAEERAYERAKQELLAQQERAVETGDTESWRQLENEKAQLEKDYKPVVAETAQQDQYNPDTDSVFTSWSADNSWYNQDVDMTMYANEAAKIVGRKYPAGTPPPREFYEEISTAVKRRFPDKFRNTNRDAVGSVQGMSQSGGRRKAGKGYSDLPAEAKQACDKYVSQGLMSKEDYIKSYFGEG